MDIPMKIRAHHLLCTQGFQGYGYSDGFVDHLKDIVVQLRANPEKLIQIAAYCDEICSGCPHQIGDRCKKDANADYRIKLIDSNILRSIGIQLDSVDTIHAMIDQINNTFETQAQLAAICGDCQWNEKCTWYLSLKK